MDSSLTSRALAASFVVAWQAAQARIKGQAELEAASQLREWAQPLPQTDYTAMWQAFALKFGEPEDKHVPAKEYIEKKLRELETREFMAEPLSEVLSRDEIDPRLSCRSGIARARWCSRRLVMANALLMIGLHHPGRVELKDTNQQLFEKYKDYLLGDYCYGLRSNEASGSLAPLWTLVLSYENAIRNPASKWLPVRSGLPTRWRRRGKKRREISPPPVAMQQAPADLGPGYSLPAE